MGSVQDISIGIGKETTYKTPVTVNRWFEFTEETLDWRKNIKQGGGLRSGGRVARSARRVIPTADGGGDVNIECVSKGLGLLFEWLFGSATSTLVSGSTFQRVYTLGDTPPSHTVQVGIPRLDGTVDPYTWAGVMAPSFELDFPNADIMSVKPMLDAADLATATAYTPPTYASAPNLFHFANGAIYNGTLTAPTATALASAVSPIADIRGGSISVDRNLNVGRFNLGGAGRKSKPNIGLTAITGKLDAEYDTTVWRDAVLSDSPMTLLLTFTAGALSTGLETLQFAIPEIKFDTELPKSNGNELIIESMSFQGLDNLTAAQPIWGVDRTSDAAL